MSDKTIAGAETRKAVWNMPGPGGNLGVCAICGDTFLTEILFGTNVHIAGMDGLEKDFCLHEKCKPILDEVQVSKDWTKFPENGPLRKFFEEHKHMIRTDSEAGRDGDVG
jgi:hypothetical protein